MRGKYRSLEEVPREVIERSLDTIECEDRDPRSRDRRDL